MFHERAIIPHLWSKSSPPRCVSPAVAITSKTPNTKGKVGLQCGMKNEEEQRTHRYLH